jgi:2-polyprenyl-6-methoxyphenol hydroxylase-like FAD-dependent oxidoreductase
VSEQPAVLLASVPDEESGATGRLGIRFLHELRLLSGRGAIYCYPGNQKLILGHRGVLRLAIETFGRAQHTDFERDFRGDTLHASVLELLDTLGLVERLLQLRHAKVSGLSLPTSRGSARVEPFGALRTRFPYITVMAQSTFLSFITEEARRYPSFELIMAADVEGLVEEAGVIRGVRYRTRDGVHELCALLTVAADGRFSTVRKLAGLTPIPTASPGEAALSAIDVLWFRLSRRSATAIAR